MLHVDSGRASALDPTALVAVMLSLAILGAYVAGVAYLGARGRRWPRRRTLGFSSGVALMALGLVLPVQPHAHAFTAHAVQHLVIGMFAPLALALGAPVTLALASLSPRARQAPLRLLHHPLVRFVSHPATAAIASVGGMAALYLTPLYALSLERQGLHHFVHVHFAVSGYLFAWAIAGVDQVPKRPSVRTRFAVLLLAAAAHGALAKLMYAHGWPAEAPHRLDDLRRGAEVMYYGGDLAELALAVALLSAWYRARGRASARRRRASSSVVEASR